MQHRRQKARLPQLLQHQGSVLLYGARMGNQNDRTVYQQEDGSWANKRNGSERAGSVHIKQAEAIAVAKSMISKSGGGELTLRGLNGEVRAVHTIAPAKGAVVAAVADPLSTVPAGTPQS